MVKNYYTKKFDLMCATEKIGEFIVQMSERGRTFRIVLDTDLSNDINYVKLHVLQKDNVIDDKGVRFWMSHRVMPANRINVDRVLREMGLYEYDQFSILEHNNGACHKDYFWIRFHEDVTFYDVHYYAEDVLRNRPWLIDDLRRRKLNKELIKYRA